MLSGSAPSSKVTVVADDERRWSREMGGAPTVMYTTKGGKVCYSVYLNAWYSLVLHHSPIHLNIYDFGINAGGIVLNILSIIQEDQ